MSNTLSLARAAHCAYEVVEERIVLSAQALPALVQHAELIAAVEMPIAIEGELAQHVKAGGDDSGVPGVTQHLNNVHAATGVADARADYGFTGAGQTVVVIDSGIAYDHEALGEGFGPGNRVVGGWDFAENDADPFDDAPAGFHGTHVAGIIGSDDATYSGVAPEVDLVALRVFDDFGNGDFAWVEDALQWVLANKDSFANPITTVNMSIGVPDQNYGDVPWWAMLEDELQDLYDAGIFVSVSAGNDFQGFYSQGLSYPAVSPWVVPVSSANDAGTAMSSFSQRDDHVLVAPGETIVSSVPDELFSFDGVANDWASASGTSMASPYVAGASVLVRQAYDFMGVENVDQAMIYDALFDTATLIYDPITAASYHFIDVEAALDSIITDMYGDSTEAATDLGTLGDADSFGEMIGKLSDRDYFTFTAAQTGTLTLSADASQQMIAQWELIGGGGSVDGCSLSFDVIAGQTYTVGLMSSGGMGHYMVNAELDSGAIDWGVVERTHVDDVAVDGETWYSITATRAGLATVEADYAGGENVNLEIYNDSGELLAGCTNTAGHARSDAQAAAGETLYIRVTGTAAAADFSLWNIVGIDGSTATVFGTSSDDTFTFAAGENHAVSVNGLSYALDGAAISSIDFQGGDGNDQIQMTGGAGNDSAILRVGASQMTGDSYAVVVKDVEVVNAIAGGGGYDTAKMYDGEGDDVLTAGPSAATFQGDGFDHTATGFDAINIYATAGGHDVATLDGSAGNDRFFSDAQLAYLRGGSYFNIARGFEEVVANAGAGGYDAAKMYDGVGDDVLTAGPDSARFQGSGFDYTANGFNALNVYASAGGNDTAILSGSAGDDRFLSNTSLAYLYGSGYFNIARGFEQVVANAGAGGYDTAKMYDGAGDDVLTAGPDTAHFQGVGIDHTATGFDAINIYATAGGHDTANLSGNAGNDRFQSDIQLAYLRGSGYFNIARGFEEVVATAGAGGYDTAKMYDGAGDDVLTAGPESARFQGSGFDHTAAGFDAVNIYATAGGHDTANLFGSSGDDRFQSETGLSYLRGDDFFNIARGFDHVSVNLSQGGNDNAKLVDVWGDEQLWAPGRSPRSAAAAVTSKSTDSMPWSPPAPLAKHPRRKWTPLTIYSTCWATGTKRPRRCPPLVAPGGSPVKAWRQASRLPPRLPNRRKCIHLYKSACPIRTHPQPAAAGRRFSPPIASCARTAKTTSSSLNRTTSWMSSAISARNICPTIRSRSYPKMTAPTFPSITA